MDASVPSFAADATADTKVSFCAPEPLAPVIYRISPTNGLAHRRTLIHVDGANFTDDTRLMVDGRSHHYFPRSGITDSSISFEVPSNPNGKTIASKVLLQLEGRCTTGPSIVVFQYTVRLSYCPAEAFAIGLATRSNKATIRTASGPTRS